MDLAALTEKARVFLKSLNRPSAETEKEPPVPEPPPDPDRLDPRVEDASPTPEDVKAAKAPATDGGEGGTETPSAPEGTKPEETKEESSEDFDVFGNRDLEGREVQKALPPVGHPEPGELPKSFDPEDLVTELLQQVGDLQAVVRDLVAQMDGFKQGQIAAGRDLKKALDTGQELQTALARLHETVPAASTPKAITKALPDAGEKVAPLLTRAELMVLAGTGQLTPLEVARLNSHLQSPAPEENR
ncbi:MAG: hypothetical protein HYZ13_09115 [Acidobacteria bacterium]|nr:hypothetical protein [Acidobacteriota bacterium]